MPPKAKVTPSKETKNFLQACTTQNINIALNYPLAPLCSFKTGSNAAMLCKPDSTNTLQSLLQLAYTHNIRVQVLAGGSNVLAPDTQLEGLTILTTGLQNMSIENDYVEIESGLSVRIAANILANAGKSALDFLYGMPGTVGGALWMNARCYGKEISQVLISASGLSLEGIPWHYHFKKEDFSYKQSPFQTHMGIITSCKIRYTHKSPELIWQDMLSHEMDRMHKGHYLAPCAGSVFKNNYDFGAPSGQLLDTLGWRTKHLNDAMVNPYHANIIINVGHALSQDIYELSIHMQQDVQKSYNINLEHEIVLLGDNTQWQK